MWYCKDDVLKDLAEYSGLRMADFDDGCVVRGSNAPPPPKQNEEHDEEFALRFKGCGDHHPFSDNSGPDLAGITHMLRMVDTYDKPPTKISNISPKKNIPEQRTADQKPRLQSPRDTNKLPKKRKPEEKIIISKLNPHVEEFIPKSFQTKMPAASETNNNTISNENDKNIANGMEVGEGVKDVKNYDKHGNAEEIVKIVKSNNSDTSTDEVEKQKMVATLKNKIRSRGDQESQEKKLEKNVAMAALLRLHSRPIATSSSNNSTPEPMSSSAPAVDLAPDPKPMEIPKPVVLFTPDYFAGPSRLPTVLAVTDSEHNIPEPKPILETPVKTPSPQNLMDPHVKESIDKVNNWLNSPDKKQKAKVNVPYLGPVVFRKKESSSPRSPSSEVSRQTKQSEPVVDIPSFVPSQYSKDIEERIKAKKEEIKKTQPPVDIWTKLEMDLKARDEKIKNSKTSTNVSPSS